MDNPIQGQVYSWVAVVVLPINSSANPVIYTLLAACQKQVSAYKLCIIQSKQSVKGYKQAENKINIVLMVIVSIIEHIEHIINPYLRQNRHAGK